MNHLLILLLGRLGIADTSHVDAQDAGLARELAELRDEIAAVRSQVGHVRARVDEFVFTPGEARDVR